jgi:3-hydroxyacyl-[acyl-carrier-protein] dehydratase
MLLNNFFTITSMETADQDIKASLVINAGHKIFEGHFPGQPVVPGVCMMQMVKEVIEQVTARQTRLVKAQEMKFLAIINPQQNNIIQATLKYIVQENEVTVTATMFKDELIHFKFKGQFAFL